MAEPASFKQANVILGPPTNMTEAECGSLNVFRDENLVISCWKMTKEEVELMISNGGRVWLTIYGQSMPPVIISAISPFEE